MFEIIDDTGQVVMIPNIMQLTDEKLVDILAWQFHVDFYDPNKDLEFKKNLVQMSIIWHKTKGTPALVQWVLDTYWPGGASLLEWFEYMEPFPPNYSEPTFLGNFGTANVSTANDTISVGVALVMGDEVEFHLGTSGTPVLPAPFVEGRIYYVVGVSGSAFKFGYEPNGAWIDITTVGAGTNAIWKRASHLWHDRYRFRVYIDEHIIDPADEAEVLELIDRYKPVSRWCEGIFRSIDTSCDIGWAGAILRFIYRTSEQPTNYP
jgi:P2-related tail formation protein